MTTVTIEKAKADLAALIDTVRAGGEVVIAKGSEPVAKLVPIPESAAEPLTDDRPRRRPGRLKGLIHLDDSFFDPLPDDELRAWNDPD